MTIFITPCQTYHALVIKQTLLRMPDQKSVFKVYYLSVVGRDNPQRYEWQYCPFTPADFEKIFLSGGYEGIGFVITFPHVTKIFRFSPYKETVLDVRQFFTENMQGLDGSHEDGFHEFACYAEAAIAAEEYAAWAQATTVEDYLAFRCSQTNFPIASSTKLAVYWNQI